MAEPRAKEVFTLVDRDDDPGNPDWIRIGHAWPNEDGGMTILLDALPLGRRLEVAEPDPED